MRTSIGRSPGMRRPAVWAAALAVVGLVLAGCSSVATPTREPIHAVPATPTAASTPTPTETQGPAPTSTPLSTPLPDSPPGPVATAQPDTPLYGPDDGPAPSPTTSLDPRSGPPTADPDDAVDDSYRRRSQFVPLDNPQFIAPGEATFLTPDDRVLGLTINGESRAYPIRMMTYHHIANDTIAGSPVLITF